MLLKTELTLQLSVRTRQNRWSANWLQQTAARTTYHQTKGSQKHEHGNRHKTWPTRRQQVETAPSLRYREVTLSRIASAAFGLWILNLTSLGCSSASTCSRGQDSTVVDPSPDHIVNGVYFSAPYGGPYQDFPGGRTIHFMHGLEKMPLAPTFWLAFAARSTATDPNPLGAAAGNLAEIIALDEKEIAVKNDSCSGFYIWFYALPQP